MVQLSKSNQTNNAPQTWRGPGLRELAPPPPRPSPLRSLRLAPAAQLTCTYDVAASTRPRGAAPPRRPPRPSRSRDRGRGSGDARVRRQRTTIESAERAHRSSESWSPRRSSRGVTGDTVNLATRYPQRRAAGDRGTVDTHSTLGDILRRQTGREPDTRRAATPSACAGYHARLSGARVRL